jgi:excisionase family DNA binding protein
LQTEIFKQTKREHLPATGDPLVSCDEIAADLGVSRPYVYTLVAGKLLPPPLKLGKLSRWRRSEVEALKASLTREVSSVMDPSKRRVIADDDEV